MASTLSDKDIEELRREAKSAEPFAYDDEIFSWFDREYTPEEELRVRATRAKLALEKAGIPLDED